MGIRHTLRRLTTGTADRSTPYDEERLDCESASGWQLWPTGKVRLPRWRRAAICLLLVDVTIVALLVHSLEPLITLLRRNEELFGARFTTSHTEALNPSSHSDRHKIPRILHQTCANETIPQQWVQSQKSCKEAYSDFEYKLWTDKTARDFISSEYPWFLETWDDYTFPIQHADSIRYFVLHHYGGVYLDMDTVCNQTFPVHQLESAETAHRALFKATRPTGITNDFMVASARHPVYAAAIAKLPIFHRFTRLWARLEPYCAIMASTGPFFLTLVVKDYLLEQPSIPSPTIQVIASSRLASYITDLETSTWHKSDTQVLKWLGSRPWAWYTLGAMGVLAGLYLLNHVLYLLYRIVRKAPAMGYTRLSKIK